MSPVLSLTGDISSTLCSFVSMSSNRLEYVDSPELSLIALFPSLEVPHLVVFSMEHFGVYATVEDSAWIHFRANCNVCAVRVVAARCKVPVTQGHGLASSLCVDKPHWLKLVFANASAELGEKDGCSLHGFTERLCAKTSQRDALSQVPRLALQGILADIFVRDRTPV
jgi:hypothetical protein